MTFVVLLTFALGALASFGVARASDRHRQWTLAMARRSRRRVLDALEPRERDAWRGAAESSAADAAPTVRPPRVVLRVRD